MIMRNRPFVKLAVCLISMAALILQSCSESGIDRDKLCGSWTSVEGKPDVLVYKEGEAYKVTVFARSGRNTLGKVAGVGHHPLRVRSGTAQGEHGSYQE